MTPEEIWFHKYRIIKRLGKGGNAEVFLAEHLKLDCLRAIKRLPKEHPYYSVLMNEARILKNLKHPNIPIIYDMEEDEGFSYIIEEYIQGQSLKAFRLNQCNIQEKTVIEISIQICNIFQSLHNAEHPILYLDLKPDNLIIEGITNTLKLVDFGASVYGSEAKKRRVSFGTAAFAAPEQFGANTVDERSDIYSLGMLIYFLAAGQEYRTDGYPGSREKRPLSEPVPKLGGGLKKVIGKCLRYYPQQRYASVTALKRDLLQLEQKGRKRKGAAAASQIIKVAGTQSRIGVTHVCQMLSGLCGTETSIQDMGVLTQENREAFLTGDKRILVAGTKGMEWNHTCRCFNLLSGVRDVVYLLNFQDGTVFRESVRAMGDRRCLRVPFCPNPGKASEQEAVRELAREIWGKPCRKKKRMSPASLPALQPEGRVIIGLTGTHRGCGVTHTAIALAFCIKKLSGKETACAELNGSGDFRRFQIDCGVEEDTETEFHVREVAFFGAVTRDKLAGLLNRGVSYFVLDFGTELTKYRNEFLRCDLKLVLCSQTPWKKEYLYRFIHNWREEPGFNTWKFLTLSGQDFKMSSLKPAAGGAGIKLFYLGFTADPTHVPAGAENLLRLII